MSIQLKVYQAFQIMKKYSRMGDTKAFEGESLDLQDGNHGSSFERSQKTAKTSVKIADNPTSKQLVTSRIKPRASWLQQSARF